ncbi:MAG: S1 RNA-binding domain-containing protein, partial [Desulfocucumaceae bacterium]
KLAGCSPGQAGTPELRRRLEGISVEQAGAQLGAGVPTLGDIIENLRRPGRDPREDLPGPLFRSDVLSLEDLRPGMELRGTVRNVVDFGAFVDIGVKVDGLVHVSQLVERYIKHPLEVVSLGDVVTVRVIEVDAQRQRISLTMKRHGDGRPMS